MSVQNQIEELKVAMKETKNRRLFERYQTVYLYLNGYKGVRFFASKKKDMMQSPSSRSRLKF